MRISTAMKTFFGISLLAGSMAMAQNTAPSHALPPPRSDNDPKPTAPSLDMPAGGVTRQAGVGGSQAYARTGVLELGGSLNFNSTTNYTAFSARPSIGYFFMDNWEASAIFAWSQTKVQGVSGGSFSMLLEPSLHLPFNDSTFAFLGMGFGLSAVRGSGLGAALAPRAGVNILVGRSGIFTPEISLQYSTNKAIATPQGTLLAVNSSFGFGAGYTVMW